MTTEKIKCCELVYPAGMGFPRPRQCSRNANIERDGKWYCGTHDPIKKQEKYNERQKKYDLQSAQRFKERRLKNAAPDLYDALKDLLPYFEGEHHPDHPQVVNAKAALAKAEVKP